MLSFLDSLKQVIADVKMSGGARIERSTPPPDVLQKLKEFSLQRIAETNAPEWTLLEWFTEGFFDEYVRVCWIHLRNLGISDNDLIYRVIAKVIESQLFSETHHWERTERDFEECLAFSLVNVWEQMGDEQTLIYTFARERWLIAWDYQKSCWKTTSLGALLLELSPVQAATFLLSIDTLFSTGEDDFHHISAEVLNELLHPQREHYDRPYRLTPLHQDRLTRLGILRDPNMYDPRRIELTPVGQIVLTRVLGKDNPLRDIASALIATEEIGDTFKSSAVEIKDVLARIDQSGLVDDANREAINTSVHLYQSGKYLASLRVVYPAIEAIINRRLIRAGQQPEQFKGVADKTRWLAQNGQIPPDVSNAIEIFTSRNKILHGNFAPPDEDDAFPLCLFVFRYLRRLLVEYR